MKGRPQNGENIALSMRCHHRDSTGHRFYRCIGEGCGWFKAGHPQTKRLLRHSVHCHKLPTDLRLQAVQWAASSSLGVKVGELKCDHATDSPGTTEGLMQGSTSGTQTSEADVLQRLATTSENAAKGKKASKSKQSKLDSLVVLGREELQQKIDF